MAGIVFSKASGLNDSIYGKSQEPIKALIESRVEAFESGRSVIKNIFVTETTDKFAEKFTYETALGNFSPVGEGGAYPESSFREGYSQVLEPDTWKNSFEVTQEMIEDSRMGKVKQRANIFTESWGRTREMYGAAMLYGGVAGSVAFQGRTFDCTTADGVALFSTAHTSVTGGANQSNLFAEAFSYDALCYAQEHMQNLTDDDGNLLGITPDTIIIPNNTTLKQAVFNAVGTEGGEPGTAVHGMNYQYGLWNIIIWPYLNAHSTTAWFLMDSNYNSTYYGAVWLDRIPLSVRSEIASNDNNVFKGRARYIAGFNDWRAISCSYAASGGTDLG